ncbi:MAG: NERD domain-containing protein [Gammaproteobacteria bacterium]|nr:NERD domain-containing protein [Gammaproteobacteria bacterium]MBU2070041.1 NERD domain-containing protein [Gammaproteobacteria bacterium]MBU2205575.1 NERD domain-containing protein [Gammaproteobacteria bacterium]
MQRTFYFLLLLVLWLPPAKGQQQYTEGACILLQQQVDRFSNQKQSSNYRNAKSEYNRFCAKPVSALQLQAAKASTRPQAADTAPVSTSAPAKVTPPTETVAQADTDLSNTVLPAKPKAELSAVSPQPLTEAEPTPQLDLAAEQNHAVAAVNSMDLKQANTPVDSTVAPVVAAPAEHLSMPDTTRPDDIWMSILSSIPLVAALLFALLLLVFLLTSWFGLNLPGFKGIFAEYKLNRLLRWRLPRSYLHFRKLKLLTEKDELIVVDHLVLSPFGVFVIAVRGERGRIYGSETEANWRREYLGRNKLLMNPLHQNFKNTEAVKQLLRILAYDASEQLHSVVAFSRVAQIESAMPANITYVDQVSTYINQFTQPCLTDEQFNRYAALLTQASSEH